MMELEDVETEYQMDHRVHFRKYLDERTCYFHLHSVHIFWLRKQNFKVKRYMPINCMLLYIHPRVEADVGQMASSKNCFGEAGRQVVVGR